MNPRVKQWWVDALRSGKYKQGRNFLYEKGAFCPLGLLCELHRHWTGLGSWVRSRTKVNAYAASDISSRFKESTILISSGVPPAPVLMWAELTPHDLLTIMNLNDGVIGDPTQRPLGFKRIAQFIEDYL